MPGPGGNVKVVARVRPFNVREISQQAKCIVGMKNNQTILYPSKDLYNFRTAKPIQDIPKSFAFDKSYWSFSPDDPHFADQADLFEDLGKPLIDNAFKGYNNCIFAYGQTGSGKSYSMMGYGKNPGVIPRICRDLFQRIEIVQQDPNIVCTMEVSYLEIYNERVRDLLNPSTKSNLRVREHPSTGPYVEDLAKLVVRGYKEIESLMDEGNKARTVAATNMNETSSRSHAVFTLTLTQKRHDSETRLTSEKVAKISLVDLAGSERVTSTGATGVRLKEGAEINRSLSTLGRVIAALADLSTGKRSKALVPYRDSVLTWLLKDSLGGNSLTAMIAAISPADINFEETLSTLRYADSAKRIKNHAVVNEDPNARMIRELKEELAQLRAKLNYSGGSPSPAGGVAAENASPINTPLDQQLVTITQPDGTLKVVSKAEIVEQLSQSEKLYRDLNQTWEEKLQRTEKIHKEREAALEELGISIEKGFVGLSTPKKMPHLVNLSDDPLLAECLIYNIKPGATIVGNVEAYQSENSGADSLRDEESLRNENRALPEIRLNGINILREHCNFTNLDGVVTIIPKEGAAVMVNGQRIDQPQRLRSGYRIILGDFHIFRFNHPQEALAEKAEQGLGIQSPVRPNSALKLGIVPSHQELKTSEHAEMNDTTPSPGGSNERKTRRDRRKLSYETHRSRSGTEFETITEYFDSYPDGSAEKKEAISAALGPEHIAKLSESARESLFSDIIAYRTTRRKKNKNPNGGGGVQGGEEGGEKAREVLSDSRNSQSIPCEGLPRDGEVPSQSIEVEEPGRSPDRENRESTCSFDESPSIDRFRTPGSESPRASNSDEEPPGVDGDGDRHAKTEDEASFSKDQESSIVIGSEIAKSDEVQDQDLDHVRHVREEMEKLLEVAKVDHERELNQQRLAYEKLLDDYRRAQDKISADLRKEALAAERRVKNERQAELARWAIRRWKEIRYVTMLETLMQNASLLKVAQVTCIRMQLNMSFQFCVIDCNQRIVSSYDLVLNEVTSDYDEHEYSPKPCIGVRLIDFTNQVIHIWSLEKLRRRLRKMWQLQQYLNAKNCAAHFRSENPFQETCMPSYSVIGYADMPLAAVFESRVQDSSLDVINLYTFSVGGLIRVSLEPCYAQAPDGVRNFNVVIHDLIGFPEREGTDVHAQLYVRGGSGPMCENGQGVVTTQLVRDFGEGPIRFDSIHSMSVQLSSPRSTSLSISIFAKITTVHLEKLVSWDEMQESAYLGPKAGMGRRRIETREGRGLVESRSRGEEEVTSFNTRS